MVLRVRMPDVAGGALPYAGPWKLGAPGGPGVPFPEDMWLWVGVSFVLFFSWCVKQ